MRSRCRHDDARFVRRRVIVRVRHTCGRRGDGEESCPGRSKAASTLRAGGCSGQSRTLGVATREARRVGRRAHRARRRGALSRRRPHVPVHRDSRGRGRDRRRGRPRDHPPRSLRLPRRDEPPDGTDRVRDCGRHEAAALRGGRPRHAADAPVRGRAAQRSRAGDVDRAARGPATGRRHRSRDRRPALVRSDDADARVRPEQSPPLHLGGRPAGQAKANCHSSGCPAVGELWGPSTGQVSRALGIGRELAAREEVDLVVVGGGPAGLGAAVYGASEGLDTLVVESTALGGQAGSSRRIENYLGFPAGISGSELTSRAVTQARKFNARTASPYRAVSLEPGNGRHLVRLEEGHEIAARAVLLATGAQYRRPPVEQLSEFEGLSVFYAAGPPEARLCGASRVGVVGGGNSAGQAAVWLSRGGALVTLLHRRGDLRETMSDYLVLELERAGVAVRDRTEIAALHGEDGNLEAVTLKSGERLPFSFLFLFLGARPVHGVARRRRGTRRRRIRSHRPRGGHREPAGDERARDLRRRRRPLGIHEAMRHGGRRRSDGRAVRPPAPRGTRTCARWERAGAAVDVTEERPMTEAAGSHPC